jgi:5-methylcytosine-specific restriction endonuclease McrA
MPTRTNETKQNDAPAAKSRPRRRSRRSAYAPAAPARLTSLPTSRTAYVETRQWLLDRHGSVCAYCERRVSEDSITLDHVTPRRGRTAYDRRDNLVLACTACNAKKADQPILAFLLANRTRAASLLRYGTHLTPMLRDLARDVAGAEAAERAVRLADPDYPYRD